MTIFSQARQKYTLAFLKLLSSWMEKSTLAVSPQMLNEMVPTDHPEYGPDVSALKPGGVLLRTGQV